MNTNLWEYEDFLNSSYRECKNAPWFDDVLQACYGLDTDELTVSAIIGEIHEGLRINFNEALKYFWTIMLINPLIAIKAYQETDLLIGKIDVYRVFKHLNPVQNQDSGLFLSDSDANGANPSKGIYNTSVRNFMIFAVEALLQKDMDPELLDAVNRNYLGGLYLHDKKIMDDKKSRKTGIDVTEKWINHRNLNHILNAIDPHHIIILLKFFADRYGARLRIGNVGKFCYSGDKYNYIIRFIKNKYGSLSEYIDWSHSYSYHYVSYYKRSLYFDEMFRNMDVIFPTNEDKNRIESLSGISIDDMSCSVRRMENRRKNPKHVTDPKQRKS